MPIVAQVSPWVSCSGFTYKKPANRLIKNNTQNDTGNNCLRNPNIVDFEELAYF